MTGCLVLAYVAFGYNIFWRGLHDDEAHIPHVAIFRIIQAFTYGPAFVIVLWTIGLFLEHKHNYHVWSYKT